MLCKHKCISAKQRRKAYASVSSGFTHGILWTGKKIVSPKLAHNSKIMYHRKKNRLWKCTSEHIWLWCTTKQFKKKILVLFAQAWTLNWEQQHKNREETECQLASWSSVNMWVGTNNGQMDIKMSYIGSLWKLHWEKALTAWGSKKKNQENHSEFFRSVPEISAIWNKINLV